MKGRNKIKKYGNKYAGQYPKMKDGRSKTDFILSALPFDEDVHKILNDWTMTILDGQRNWQAAMEELQKKETRYLKQLNKMEPYRDLLLSMADEI